MASNINSTAPPPPPPPKASSSTISSSTSPLSATSSLSPPVRTKPTPRHKHTQSHHYNDAPDLAALTTKEESARSSRSKGSNRASRVPQLGSIPSTGTATPITTTTTITEGGGGESLVLPAFNNFNSPRVPPPLPINSIRQGPRSLPYDVTHFPPPSLSIKLCIVFIPGNPGLISYYDRFLSSLQNSLPHDLKEVTEIYAVGHLGHSLKGEEEGMMKQVKKYEQHASLEEQVESKIQFIDELRDRYRQEVEGDVKIMLMGHSIGSWICLQILKQRPSLIKSAHLLFPTISSMSLTRNGQKLSPLFSSWALRPLFYSTSLLSYLPTSLLSTLVSLLTGQSKEAGSGQGSGSGIEVTTKLVSSPQTVIAAITMAQKELKQVTELDREFLKNQEIGKKCWWYWTEPEKDGWVLEESVKEIEECLGHEPEMKERRERCKEGMPHAFVLNKDHSDSLAKTCAGWIVKDLESIQ